MTPGKVALLSHVRLDASVRAKNNESQPLLAKMMVSKTID
jgi:hypothetical protein